MWDNWTNQPGYIAKFNDASGVFETFTNRLISPVYGPMGIAISPAFPDFNNDGMVGAEDYVIWRRTIGATVSPYSGADGNGNGIIDQADYEIWRSHFGNTSSPPPLGSATNVPEPSTAGLALLLMTIPLLRRRRAACQCSYWHCPKALFTSLNRVWERESFIADEVGKLEQLIDLHA